MSEALLYLHITAGTFSILAGFAALFSRKGESVHRIAGSVFFVAMLVMCSSAFVVATLRGQTINIYASLTTLYFLGTSWMTVTRPDRSVGRFESAALVGAVLIAASAVIVAGGSSRTLAVFLYIIAGLVALAAVFDVSLIARGGVMGAQRIARHLWRMTFAMFVATGSFFLGQAKFIPPEVKAVYLNAVPPVLVLVLLAYWLVRVLLTRWYQAPGDARQPIERAAFAEGSGTATER
jgi:hypothetical protein